MRNAQLTLVFATMATLSLGRVAPARADRAGQPAECKEIEKGDVEACTAAVKKSCTQEGYWDRRRCVSELVPKYDACGSPAAEKAAAEGERIYKNYCDSINSFLDDPSASNQQASWREDWAKRVQKVDKESAKYAPLDKEWRVCSNLGFGEGPLDDCEKAPQRYRESFLTEVQKVLASADGPIEYAKEQAQDLLRIYPLLPEKWRRGEAELQAMVKRADDAAAAEAQKFAADLEKLG